MEHGPLTAGAACLLLLVLVAQASAVAGAPERSVVPAGDSTYRVTLLFPEGTVTGITEIIPGGMSVREISLPPEQYQVDGTTLILALIGEPEVSYLVIVKPGEPGEITGTYQDMLTGEVHTLPGAAISGSGSVEITGASAPVPVSGNDGKGRPAPMDPALFVSALCAAGLLYWARRSAK